MELAKEIQPGLAAISGGLGDIGLAIALALKQAGAEIAICDTAPRPAALEADYFHAVADVSDASAIADWFEEVSAHFGRPPNIIVPNAAIVTTKGHLELSPDEWKREIDINLNGAFYFTDAGIRPLVKTEQPGRVVFIGSWAAHAPHSNLPAYCVAKAGLRMLSKTLALELAAHGILVNEVAPGYVDAGLSGRIFAANPELKQRETARVPIRKLLSAADVAAQVMYLCSEAGNHITGTTILQDGGLSLLQGPTS